MFPIALQRVKLRRNDKVATHPGRFPFPSRTDGLRKRAALEAGFSGRHETIADASRPGSDAYTSLFFFFLLNAFVILKQVFVLR